MSSAWLLTLFEIVNLLVRFGSRVNNKRTNSKTEMPQADLVKMAVTAKTRPWIEFLVPLNDLPGTIRLQE
jgi:hypothetical protein